ncbi:hypothetical protein HY771_03395, partial [Candidatus Uhrbacteria bacterium]|nr:hypothetical protein [Candidatus Uhrbacteria bacterium]
MSEEFRGHLEDCVHDLNARLESRHPKGSKKAAHARQPIADFCGVKAKAVTRWLHSAESLPNGLQLIKLMCFLELLGYRVIEWERIPTARRNFTELVGFGLLSIEQSLELLGYSNTTTVYQVLLGHYGPSKDKDRII